MPLPPEMPLPTISSPAKDFESYNKEATRIFMVNYIFVASYHTLCQFRLQQYTPPTVIRELQIFFPLPRRTHSRCRPSLNHVYFTAPAKQDDKCYILCPLSSQFR